MEHTGRDYLQIRLYWGSVAVINNNCLCVPTLYQFEADVERKLFPEMGVGFTTDFVFLNSNLCQM